MGVSTLDGTIEDVELKRSARNIRIFRQIRFRLRDGGSRTIGKAVVEAAVAQHLQRGAAGRFYLYSTLEHKGVHGLRDGEGRAVFGFPRTNEIAMLVLVLINLVWVGFSMFVLARIPIIGALILLLLAPYYIHLRKVRGDARRQFERDSQFSAGTGASADALRDRFA